MLDKKYEPRLVDGKKFCHFDSLDCHRPMYARGVCRLHYMQLGRNHEPTRLYSDTPDRKCAYPPCENNAVSRTGVGIYCFGHASQVERGAELRELNPHLQGYSEDATERTCKICLATKPVSDYYRRNQWVGYSSKTTQCKECFKKDVMYYQGKRDTRADGTDPKGYQQDREAQAARRAKANGGVKVHRSKLSGFCQECKTDYSAGSLIVWISKDEMYHYECYMKTRK